MKKFLVMLALFGAVSSPARAEFTGDVKLACEAILCLSTGTRPTECAPSIARYFSISYKKWSDTLRGRIDFLNLCPAASSDQNMQKLVNAIGSGAGRCDADSLNSSLRIWIGDWDGGYQAISNQMPDYCAAYVGNSYTDLSKTKPRYVGVPDRGGYWVPAAEYD